jgi:hypothetical protein
MKRFAIIEQLIASIHNDRRKVRILDLGGTQQYWELFSELLENYNCYITIANLDINSSRSEDGRFSFVSGDACDKLFPDMSFNFVHSNSVIEHVGDWNRMDKMAQQVRSLAPIYYVQVPYFWFPFEPHFRVPFFHWVPEQLRARLAMQIALGVYKKQTTFSNSMRLIQSANLLDKKQLMALFPDANIKLEKAYGVTKSLIAIRQTK